MIDSIKFRLINLIEEKEEWALDYESLPTAVEIYINNHELISILKEIEAPFAEAEGHSDLAGAYGHISSNLLYKDLSDVLNGNKFLMENGVELLCCSGCGDSGCWSILVFVSQDEDYIYWNNFKHNHRNWKYDISYKFDKKEYMKALQQLK